MKVEQRSNAMVCGLHEAGVEFVVVGGLAAVLQAVPILTEDLDIVHRRTPENVARLLPWLLAHGAYNRADLANRRLPPREDALLGGGHVNLQTDLGKLDILCELAEGEGYDEILLETVVLEPYGFPVRVLSLPRLITAKKRAARPKDIAVLHVIIATLDEQRKRKATAAPTEIEVGVHLPAEVVAIVDAHVPAYGADRSAVVRTIVDRWASERSARRRITDQRAGERPEGTIALCRAIGELTGVPTAEEEISDLQHEVRDKLGLERPTGFGTRAPWLAELVAERDAVLADVHAGILEDRYTPKGSGWTPEELEQLLKHAFRQHARAKPTR